MSKTVNLDLAAIRTDGGTQMRVELSRDVFLDYRDKWLAGVRFDPIDVFHDGSTYWLADGFHRFYGAREAKQKTIPANVRQGTVRDAILFACAANVAHGLRRTNADKRRAVETLLGDEEWCKWSDRQIAEQAGVGNALVSEMRNQLCESNSSSPAAKANGQPRLGRDGKRRKAPKRTTRMRAAAATSPALSTKSTAATDQQPKPSPIKPSQDQREPGVFTELRRLFDAMTPNQRSQAFEMWAAWTEDA